MLSDAQWGELEPLIEACRPRAKTPPKELRRTISAILWRHQNGAKWRAIPEKLGAWWQAAQIFIRWARAGMRNGCSPACRSTASRWAWPSSMAATCGLTRKQQVRQKRGDLRPSEMIVKHLAALVGAMAPSLRDRRRTRARHRLPHRAWAGTRTPPRHSASRPVARRAQVGRG